MPPPLLQPGHGATIVETIDGKTVLVCDCDPRRTNEPEAFEMRQRILDAFALIAELNALEEQRIHLAANLWKLTDEKRRALQLDQRLRTAAAWSTARRLLGITEPPTEGKS